MIRVFRFLKDVQHEPRAQMAGHSKGEILMTGRERGVSVSRRGDEVSLVTGLGTSDEFRIGVELEELSGLEAQRHIREAALAKLSPEERSAILAFSN